MSGQPGEVTQLLAAWAGGDGAAREALIPHVYPELRRIATAHLRRERRDHTLQPTALVHEAYLRLIGQERVAWRDRVHFLAVASTLMRRVLVDHARRAGYAKRGGGRLRVTLVDFEDRRAEHAHLVLEVDRLLERLAARDATKASVVELRFFGGLTERETAEVLRCSPRTVTRHWRTARAWLMQSLDDGDGSPRGGRGG